MTDFHVNDLNDFHVFGFTAIETKVARSCCGFPFITVINMFMSIVNVTKERKYEHVKIIRNI